MRLAASTDPIIIVEPFERVAMTTPFTLQDHFAHCVQILGGTTAFSRRLGIDERAIRRFINGERPVTPRLLEDTAAALRQVVTEATAAEAEITAALANPSSL